jgi:hypothetical protein
MDTVGIAGAGRKWIDNKHVDAVVEQLVCFADELLERASAGLVAGGDDFEPRDQAVATDVPDRDRTLQAGIEWGVGFGNETGRGSGLECSGRSHPASVGFFLVGALVLRGKHVRTIPGRDLFRQSIVIVGKKACI